ncbi:MAG: UDP-glucose 4-epimerase GalE [Rhizobiaceae bacterium]
MPRDKSKEVVFVTGGAGYIGSHVCKALAEEGYHPVVYDNMVQGHTYALKWGDHVVGDICDKTVLSEALNRYEPIAVIHFAALSLVGSSMVNPDKYYWNNVAGTMTILDAMRDVGINTIVFSSSAAVYGVPDIVPIQESAPIKPINPYGRTKAFMEDIISDYSSAFGLNWSALRYFNAAGAASSSAGIGEDHSPETHLIPLILDVAAQVRPRAKIFGDDYETPDGTCVRDYVHVLDLADAHVLAMQGLMSGMSSGPVNLGVGRGFSVMEVIETVRLVTGAEIKVEICERRPGDPPVLVADVSLAGERLGWKTKRPALSQMVEDAWTWHQKLRSVN